MLSAFWQDALAPYKHIEEDLKSLKEVLEMKNQQIHQQDLKITELEKIVGLKFLLLFCLETGASPGAVSKMPCPVKGHIGNSTFKFHCKYTI